MWTFLKKNFLLILAFIYLIAPDFFPFIFDDAALILLEVSRRIIMGRLQERKKEQKSTPVSASKS